MKPILLAALVAVPLAFTGCGTYVGYDDGYYGPGYYGPGYYDGGIGVVDVGYYGYDRGGYYHHHYGHYDSGYHGSIASRGFSHTTHVASVSRTSSFHSSGGSHASASMGHGGFGGRR